MRLTCTTTNTSPAQSTRAFDAPHVQPIHASSAVSPMRSIDAASATPPPNQLIDPSVVIKKVR